MGNTRDKEDTIFTLRELRRQINKKANVVIAEMKVCVKGSKVVRGGTCPRGQEGG